MSATSDANDIFNELDSFLDETTKASRLRTERDALQHKLRAKSKHMPKASVERIKEDLSRLTEEIEAARWQVVGTAIFWRRTHCTTCGTSHVQFESFGQRQVTYTVPHTHRIVRFVPAQTLPQVNEAVYHDHIVPCCQSCFNPADVQSSCIIKESR